MSDEMPQREPVGGPAASAPTALPESPVANPAQQRVFRWFFFGVFALLVYQLALVLSIFSDIIIWASSLALVCFPIHEFMQRRLPGRPTGSAMLSTLVVLLMVLVPIITIVSIVVQQSAQLYPTLRGWISALQATDGGSLAEYLPHFLRSYWERVSSFLGESMLFSQFDLREYLLKHANAAGLRIANFGTTLARNVALGLLNLLLILVLLFFCFLDGQRFLRWIFATVPMPVAHAQAIARRIYLTVTAVIRGALLTAAAQGALAMLGYLVAGVPLAVFFGVVTGVAAMIPFVGAGLVWLPIGIFVYMKEPGWGIFVLAWGFFVVSLIDNLMRPWLIGAHARMPILLIFCGIIGGVNVYGVTGLMIGPILMASVLAFAGIYRDYYAPPAAAEQPGAPGPR